MKFRLELEEWEVRNLIGIINVAPMTGQDAEGVCALKAKILGATAIVEIDEEKVEAARNGDAS